MIERTLAAELENALRHTPAVALLGPRQVGKTTLALEFLKEKKYSYLTFDDEITYLC